VPERVPRWLRITVSVVVALVVGWMLITDSGDESTASAVTTTSAFVDPGADLVPGPTTSNDSDDSVDTGNDGSAEDAIGVSGLPAGFVAELPPEALVVLDRIADGASHPYRQDGSTFFNREGLLPFEGDDYYREYTVETPGSSDRGARRIVTGARGEVFYTDDHYGSFVEVVDADV
jgi:ribonuclease T1